MPTKAPLIQSKITLTFPATAENWAILSHEIDDLDLPKHDRLTLRLICEEIYTNIVKYAYDSAGQIRITFCRDSGFSVRFCDWGRPYNPLKTPSPDITQDAKHRQIGGLGLFLVRRRVKALSYARRNKQNILRLTLK